MFETEQTTVVDETTPITEIPVADGTAGNGEAAPKRKRAPRASKPRAEAEGKKSPTGKVGAYIEALRTTAEKRFATKEWRRLDGQRATRATPFDLTSGRAASIRTELAGIMGVAAPAARPASARKAKASAKPRAKKAGKKAAKRAKK